MEDKKNNLLWYLVLIAIILFIAYKVYDTMDNENSTTNNQDVETEYVMHSKKYGVNEYSKLNISDEQMATIYYSEYINLLRSNDVQAYELVDSDYKKYKVKNINEFRTFINSRNIKNGVLDKYQILRKEGYVYYLLNDNKGNTIVFKTNGVMQYTVYLDNETVVIK